MPRNQSFRFVVSIDLALEDENARPAARRELEAMVREALEETVSAAYCWNAGRSVSTYLVASSTVEPVDPKAAKWLSGNPPRVPASPRVRDDEPAPVAEPSSALADRLANAIPRGGYVAGISEDLYADSED